MMKIKNNSMTEIFSRSDVAQSDYFKLFDWKKCIDLLIENDIQNAKFGLFEDWELTCATGFKDGKPHNGSDESEMGTFLGSWWATPCIIDVDTNDAYMCFKKISEKKFAERHIFESEDWWPQYAAEYYADKKYGDNKW